MAVDGCDLPVLLDFAFSPATWAMVLVGVRGETDENGWPLGMPARLVRQVATREHLADVLRTEGHEVPSNPPVSAETAELLVRGRDKSRASVAMMRARATVVGERLIGEGVVGRQLYQRVADELGVGRTTAYTYVSDAGVIGKAAGR